MTYPWATRICTPEAFKKTLPRAQFRYAGLHELAYLHPRIFVPDPAIRAEMGLRPDEPFAILRLVSWKAAHDRGHRGLSADDCARAAQALSAHGRVFVSAEGAAPPGLRVDVLPVGVHRIHHALALARVYLGEGATMATEAGLLGTPSVYASTLVGTMGNFDLLASEDLVRSFRDGSRAVEEAARLMADEGARAAWAARAAAFAARQSDMTELICGQLLELGQTGRLRGFPGALEARP